MIKNRASSSSHASSYKIQGHKDEEEFSSLLEGKIIKGTGKADFIDKNGKQYSIKGGAKKWQIFLYSRNRFLNDQDFQSDELGNLFINCLDCFPEDYATYKRDKDNAKELLLDFFSRTGRKPADVNEYINLIGDQNTYLSAKLKLKKANEDIKKYLQNAKCLEKFLNKSIFDNYEVDFWAIKKNLEFNVYRCEEAISRLSKILKPSLSQQINGRPDDINLPGQKVLLKFNTNVIELEVRNDSERHYRQIRFNMLREKTLNILEKNSLLESSADEKIKYYMLGEI